MTSCPTDHGLPRADERSWGDAASIVYGQLPYGLMDEIRTRFIALLKASHSRIVQRTE